jgi:hypothetical protein
VLVKVAGSGAPVLRQYTLTDTDDSALSRRGTGVVAIRDTKDKYLSSTHEERMQHEKLSLALINAMAGVGDIYTDAYECSASVLAAQNLSILANLLEAESTALFIGDLYGDGKLAGQVSVEIDGKLRWVTPNDVDVSAENWELDLEFGPRVSVAFFEGGVDFDARWVVDDSDTFYRCLLEKYKDNAVR